MFDLTGKTAVITGASKGIGAATSKTLAQCGAAVVLCARSTADLEHIADDISGTGGNVQSLQADVSCYAELSNVVDQAVAIYGGVDILVNNAGVIDPVSRIDHSDPAAWSHAVDVNLKGVYYGLRAALPVMLEQGHGTIINLSSGAATHALEGWSHYCATKAAVLSLTQCVHKEYAEQGITVIGLSPGTVATQMQVVIKDSGINPVSQLSPSDHIPAADVARAIAWLCTEEARELSGTAFSLRGAEARSRVGLQPLA